MAERILKTEENSDATSSSSSSSASGSATTTGADDPATSGNIAPKDAIPVSAPRDGATASASMQRSLGDETPQQDKAHEPELDMRQRAEREAARVAQELGLNATQTANLAFSVGSQAAAGADVATAIRNDVPKISGIDPAILAMATEAGRKMTAANMDATVRSDYSGALPGMQNVGIAQDAGPQIGPRR